MKQIVLLIFSLLFLLSCSDNQTIHKKNIKENTMEPQQINAALKFANYLASKEYISAFNMLSSSLQNVYSADKLKESMNKMTNYFNGDTLKVEENFFEDEIGNDYIYIPIGEDGN